jgi:hypothetical protein
MAKSLGISRQTLHFYSGAPASQAAAAIPYGEDFNHGQTIEGVKINS